MIGDTVVQEIAFVVARDAQEIVRADVVTLDLEQGFPAIADELVAWLEVQSPEHVARVADREIFGPIVQRKADEIGDLFA